MSIRISEAALTKLIDKLKYYIDEAEVIGLGTGRTVTAIINYLVKGNLLGNKLVTASSIDTTLKLSRLGINVIYPISVNELDLYIDSADEVDPNWNMIKGGGAALTMEKILTTYSRRRLFVVTKDKLVDKLCSKHYIPLDVIPESVSMVCNYLRNKGFEVIIREGSGKRGPVRSDFGGVIIDVKPPSELLNDLKKLDQTLTLIPGVISSGLFIDLVDVGYVIDGDEVIKHVKRS